MSDKQFYCIRCGEMVYQENNGGHMVMRWPLDLYASPEVDYCEFPDGWATCAPPDVNMDDYINTVVPPTDEEIAQMEAG